jgi:hypothetical protein
VLSPFVFPSESFSVHRRRRRRAPRQPRAPA